METLGQGEVEGEVWLTAKEIIADQGFNAEIFVIRLAARLEEEGNMEDAVKLGAVLDAITALRVKAGIRPLRAIH